MGDPRRKVVIMRSIEEISKTNPEKPLLLEVDGKEYYRCPIHTQLVKVGDDLSGLLRQYVLPYFQEGDCVYISEKIVSLCLSLIHISSAPLARQKGQLSLSLLSMG